MQVALSVGSLALAAVVAVHWAATRVDALGRRRRFPVVRVVLLVALGVGLAVPVARTARLENRLSAVASQLAGRPVEVDCRSGGAELVHAGSDLGRVDVGADGAPGDVAVLGRAVCADVDRWRRGADDGADDGERPDVDGAVAVHVLTHEAMHLAGELDEARAECAAVQRDVRTAQLLGATDDRARRLARTYWLVTYPTLPEAYRTAACGPGGALDEGGPDAPWRLAAAAGPAVRRPRRVGAAAKRFSRTAQGPSRVHRST